MNKTNGICSFSERDNAMNILYKVACDIVEIFSSGDFPYKLSKYFEKLLRMNQIHSSESSFKVGTIFCGLVITSYSSNTKDNNILVEVVKLLIGFPWKAPNDNPYLANTAVDEPPPYNSLFSSSRTSRQNAESTYRNDNPPPPYCHNNVN